MDCCLRLFEDESAVSEFLLSVHSFFLRIKCALFSEFNALKLLDIPKLALNLSMSIYLLHFNICMHN